MDNPEILATLGTQETGQTLVNKPLEKTKGTIKNGQSGENWQHWEHKTQDEDKQNKWQSRMANPEKLATLGNTRHRTNCSE